MCRTIALLAIMTLTVPCDQIDTTIEIEGPVSLVPRPESGTYIALATDYDIDSDNNVYILDHRKCCVYAFDSNGELIRTFGRSGQGPGEFDKIGSMEITRDRLYVTDGSLARITEYYHDGRVNRIFSTKGLPVDIIVHNNYAYVSCRSSSVIVWKIALDNPEEQEGILSYDNELLADIEPMYRRTEPSIAFVDPLLAVALPNSGRIVLLDTNGEQSIRVLTPRSPRIDEYWKEFEEARLKARLGVPIPQPIRFVSPWYGGNLLVEVPSERLDGLDPDSGKRYNQALAQVFDINTGDYLGINVKPPDMRSWKVRLLSNHRIAWLNINQSTLSIARHKY